jgi:hypothetical protein
MLHHYNHAKYGLMAIAFVAFVSFLCLKHENIINYPAKIINDVTKFKKRASCISSTVYKLPE